MFSKRIKIILIAVPAILVLGLLIMIWRAKPPRKPVDIPPGDYSLAVAYAGDKIQWAIDRYHLPGVAVSLIDDQETIWQEAFGVANLEANTPVDSHTVYKLWSVAKVFTALETLRLVEDGLVDLDTPITEYLPNFSIQSRFPDSAPITIRTILTHRAGLPRNECHWIDYSEGALASLVDSLRDCHLAFPVGDRYKYSNMGFDLLGYLIQEKRGGLYQDYMRENLLIPIGMHHSSFLRAQVPPGLELAPGYEYYQDQYYPYEQGDITSFPSGNLYSTIEDMGQFAKFIFRGRDVNGGQIISPETFEIMFADQLSGSSDPQPMGLGWKTAYVLGSERMVWHEGGPGDGTGALVALLPERQLGVVLIANGTAFEVNVSLPLALDLLELLLKAKYGVDVPQEQTQEQVALDRSVLGKYVGKYAAFGNLLEVSLDGTRLKGSFQGITVRLIPLSQTTFQMRHWLADLGLAEFFGVPFDLRQAKIEFILGERNDVDGLIINYRDILFETCSRYPQWDQIPPLWEGLVGEYDLLARLPSGAVGAEALGQTSIQLEEGVLYMSGPVGPIIPLTETEIVILTGPLAGEIMIYDPHAGSITHQNIVYQPR